MNIKISLDNLDSAIKQVESLITKVENFTGDVATEERDKVGYSAVSVVHAGNNHTIIAQGSDGEDIAFVEWGAGYDASYVHGFTDMGGDIFESEPGVWSESHEKTFQRHQESGKQPSTYRYNRLPRHRMESTARRIQGEIVQKAREYFR